MLARLMPILLLILAGCSNITHTPPTYQKIDQPKIGVVSVSELGESMISKIDSYTYSGINLKNKIHTKTWAGMEVSLFPQQLVCSLQDNKYSFCEGIVNFDSQTGIHQLRGGLKFPLSNEGEIFIYAPEANFEKSVAQEINYERIAIPVENNTKFKQEFIFNGRSGDELKFIYREISGNIMRAPFRQDVSYNLKDGKVIGFKGSRIEIIEASNTEIKYKVLSGFTSAN